MSSQREGFNSRPRRSDNGDDFTYNFICNLQLGLKNGLMKLYSGTHDDKDICEYGGKNLTVSGVYLDDRTHVLIEEVSSSLYFANGWNLYLIQKPFIMNMKTKKVVSEKELAALGVASTPSRRPKSAGDPPDLVRMAAASRANEIEAIVQRGGLPQYLEWLWSQQEHIRNVAAAKKAASAYVTPPPWTPEALDAWFNGASAARAHADTICCKNGVKPITV